MCEIFGVSSSAYYRWSKAEPSAMGKRHQELAEVII
ncbi:hypothetical protein MNBD_GAMMA08-871 [hydrothermal vent metagenome]|uniref:Uncharacterized protein n=1 Tax=hydrothermal vent metagenome TaxID=652676 RepID=A0A3B0X4Q0_9ZZZZ